MRGTRLEALALPSPLRGGAMLAGISQAVLSTRKCHSRPRSRSESVDRVRVLSHPRHRPNPHEILPVPPFPGTKEHAYLFFVVCGHMTKVFTGLPE